MATGNPIVGADQDVAALMLQGKVNFENFALAKFGEGKHHEKSSSSICDFLRERTFKYDQKFNSKFIEFWYTTLPNLC